jgi:hypothetical protein
MAITRPLHEQPSFPNQVLNNESEQIHSIQEFADAQTIKSASELWVIERLGVGLRKLDYKAMR